MSKFDRSNFYKQEIVNNKLEYDLVKNYWDLFKIKRPIQYINISRQFLQRPDIFSYAVYRDPSFWWIISKFNNIDDWWNDLTVGESISIPDIRDIDDWFLLVLSMNTTAGNI